MLQGWFIPRQLPQSCQHWGGAILVQVVWFNSAVGRVRGTNSWFSRHGELQSAKLKTITANHFTAHCKLSVIGSIISYLPCWSSPSSACNLDLHGQLGRALKGHVQPNAQSVINLQSRKMHQQRFECKLLGRGEVGCVAAVVDCSIPVHLLNRNEPMAIIAVIHMQYSTLSFTSKPCKPHISLPSVCFLSSGKDDLLQFPVLRNVAPLNFTHEGMRSKIHEHSHSFIHSSTHTYTIICTPCQSEWAWVKLRQWVCQKEQKFQQFQETWLQTTEST